MSESEKTRSSLWPIVFIAGAAVGAVTIYALRKRKPGDLLDDLLGSCEDACHKVEDLTHRDGFAAAS